VRERFTARVVGYVRKPVSRGALAGNIFHITLRDCCPDVERRIGEAVSEALGRRVPNFYGLQRFGTSGAGTHRIGSALVKARFEEAVSLILLSGPSSPGQDAEKASKEAFEAGKYEEGLRHLSRGKDVERLVARELSKHPGQWIGALRAIPLRLRRFYVQAYQSQIFNKTLSAAVADGEDISELKKGDNWAETALDGLLTLPTRGVRDVPGKGAVPMVQVAGYAYRNYGSRFDRYVEGVLDDEGVRPRQFYVKEMQEVSSEGGFRRPHLALQDASWTLEEDAARLSFTLGKGQYATILLREIAKPRDPAAAGLA